MKNFVPCEKIKILHRCRTIKGPMKNPAPHKILEKFCNTNEIGFSLFKYYIPAKSGSFEFGRFEPLNRIRTAKKSVRIRIDFFKSFEFSNSEHPPKFECSEFRVTFSQILINFLQNCARFFAIAWKKFSSLFLCVSYSVKSSTFRTCLCAVFSFKFCRFQPLNRIPQRVAKTESVPFIVRHRSCFGAPNSRNSKK